MDCLATWLDLVLKRRAKRNLNNNAVKFYPHSILTLHLQLATAFEYELVRFARMWCVDEPAQLIDEIRAVKEIFETENQDDLVAMIELLANKYML